jgi:hypothetical protein
MNVSHTEILTGPWVCFENLGFPICVLFTLIAPLIFGLRNQPTEMGPSIVAGCISMIFFRLDSIQSFKGLGFELRILRQQLNRNAATIEQLQNLSVILARPVLGLLIGAGRFGGMADTRKTVEELNASLRLMGMSEKQVEEANSIYNAYMTWDHGFHVQRRLPKQLGGEARDSIKTLHDYGELRIASPQDFRRELAALDLLDEEAEEAIKDYEYFLEHHKLRRPELWQQERIRPPASVPGG